VSFANVYRQLVRRIFWAVIIENKGGLGEETVFEFKYIPDLSKKTRREDPDDTGLKQPGVERRNLQAFAVGCCILVMLCYFWIRLFGSMLTTFKSFSTI